MIFMISLHSQASHQAQMDEDERNLLIIMLILVPPQTEEALYIYGVESFKKTEGMLEDPLLVPTEMQR